jgi:cytidine deaminase
VKPKFKFRLVNGLKTYEIPKTTIDAIFEAAKKAAPNTFPLPDKVSSAVLTSKHTIYSGAEYRTDILALSMHAEAVALAHASTHGEAEIIAITGPNCHACKQLLWENAMRFGNDITILIKEDGKIKQIPLSSMMIYPWPKNHWKNKSS